MQLKENSEGIDIVYNVNPLFSPRTPILVVDGPKGTSLTFHVGPILHVNAEIL